LDNEFSTHFKMQDFSVKCLIDTGAESSLLSEKIARKLQCHLGPTFIFLKGGNLTPASHKTTLKIEKDGTAFEITFYVVDSSVMRPGAILGRDLLNYKGIQICTDSQGTRLYFNNVQNIHNVAISTETVHTSLTGFTVTINN
jgi:predicted aspartyl protease